MENNIKKEKEDNIGVLVKTTHACNFNCEYCYDKQNREKYGSMVLSEDKIKKLIDLTADYASSINWTWHGGEPTCAPISSYKNVQDYFLTKYRNVFSQSMQSNGGNLNKEWLDFFNEANISVGFSYDGRKTLRNGTDKYDLLTNFKNYRKEKGELGFISVINETNVHNLIDLYKEIIADTGATGLAYNHVFHKDAKKDDELLMTPKEYQVEYLKFINWLYHTDIFIERTAMYDLQTLLGYKYDLCTYRDCRKTWIGVAPDGTIFPCDRYYPEKYSCGNVDDYDKFEDIFNSDGYQLYSSEVEAKYVKYCYKCPYFYHCRGGCNANSIAKFGSADILDEDSCLYFKKRFNATYVALRDIDIYTETLNPYIPAFLLNSQCVTPKEIKDNIYNILGLDYDFVSKDFILQNDDALFNTVEYKLLRLFNPLTDTYATEKCEKHIFDFDCVIPNVKRNNLENLKETREQGLFNFIKNNAEEIFTIIKGGK